MNLEDFLGWLVAFAWLVFFSGVVIIGLRNLFRDPAGSIKAFRVEPRLYATTLMMVAGLLVFLWWIVGDRTALSIGHIRPYGIPIGLWGLGTATVGWIASMSK